MQTAFEMALLFLSTYGRLQPSVTQVKFQMSWRMTQRIQLRIYLGFFTQICPFISQRISEIT